jgi:hypothetical protein
LTESARLNILCKIIQSPIDSIFKLDLKLICFLFKCFEKLVWRGSCCSVPASVWHQGLLHGAVRAHNFDETHVQGGDQSWWRLLALLTPHGSSGWTHRDLMHTKMKQQIFTKLIQLLFFI